MVVWGTARPVSGMTGRPAYGSGVCADCRYVENAPG